MPDGKWRAGRWAEARSAILLAWGSASGPSWRFGRAGLPRAEDVQLDGRVLLFALAVSLASGSLVWPGPALRVPSRGLEQALRAGSRTVAGESLRRLHSGFVVFRDRAGGGAAGLGRDAGAHAVPASGVARHGRDMWGMYW